MPMARLLYILAAALTLPPLPARAQRCVDDVKCEITDRNPFETRGVFLVDQARLDLWEGDIFGNRRHLRDVRKFCQEPPEEYGALTKYAADCRKQAEELCRSAREEAAHAPKCTPAFMAASPERTEESKRQRQEIERAIVFVGIDIPTVRDRSIPLFGDVVGVVSRLFLTPSLDLEATLTAELMNKLSAASVRPRLLMFDFEDITLGISVDAYGRLSKALEKHTRNFPAPYPLLAASDRPFGERTLDIKAYPGMARTLVTRDSQGREGRALGYCDLPPITRVAELAVGTDETSGSETFASYVVNPETCPLARRHVVVNILNVLGYRVPRTKLERTRLHYEGAVMSRLAIPRPLPGRKVDYLSLGKVLSADFDIRELEGKIVLFGAARPELGIDTHHLEGERMAGTYVIASALQALLDDDTYDRVPLDVDLLVR